MLKSGQNLSQLRKVMFPWPDEVFQLGKLTLLTGELFRAMETCCFKSFMTKLKSLYLALLTVRWGNGNFVKGT